MCENEFYDFISRQIGAGMMIQGIKKPRHLCTTLKYVFSVLLTVAAFCTVKNVGYLIIGIAELLVIATATDMIAGKKRILGIVLNDILMAIYNAQMMVLYFGRSYVLLIMLTNVDSIQGLSGKAIQYICGAVLVGVFSLLPITPSGKAVTQKALSGALAVELVATLFAGNAFSPVFGIYHLAEDFVGWKQQSDVYSDENVTPEFYRTAVDNYREKDPNLAENPNVILIMTEGLSQEIVADERNIMPNLLDLQSNALNFTGYYNHTFATYRGIIGQLYSGYQLNNLDGNTLVSLQEIFKDRGYSTFFVNTEPVNTQFTEYINNLKFDEVIGDASSQCSGPSNTMSDKEAYQTLWETVAERENGEPFFGVMYTFGTHVSLDSPDEKYGDGSSLVLNKFYNLDLCLAEFLDKFDSSPLADNTILVFTADHATYADNDYASAFPDSARQHGMLDEMPLLIYYKGIQPETIDVDGRNSLDLAPTILDYLDISQANYFLGTSLFSPKQNNNSYDTIFVAESTYLDTDGGNITGMSDAKLEIIRTQLQKYFTAKMQDPIAEGKNSNVANAQENILAESDQTSIYAEVSQDCNSMKIVLETDQTFNEVWFPTWSVEGDQDDIQWYQAAEETPGTWTYTVDLTQHHSMGTFVIHAYADGTTPDHRIAVYDIQVKHLPETSPMM